MRKAIVFSLLSFTLGLAIAITVLVNPFGWNWVKPVHKEAMSALNLTHPSEEGVEGHLWTCGMHPQVIQEEPGDCPICGMALTPVKSSTGNDQSFSPASKKEKKIKHWVAPMDPTYISDQPGKSPMGMDLVPVYEEDQKEESHQALVFSGLSGYWCALVGTFLLRALQRP